jgi:hypothetical protein
MLAILTSKQELPRLSPVCLVEFLPRELCHGYVTITHSACKLYVAGLILEGGASGTNCCNTWTYETPHRADAIRPVTCKIA